MTLPDRPMEDRIRGFLETKNWLADVESVDFLAAGEYNENYLISTGKSRYVFRINHGSQLGLTRQIEYEFGVLKCLQDSTVTPRPFACDTGRDAPGRGVLLMEYVPGDPLDYRRDVEIAAEIFARVHSVEGGEGLIVQSAPVRDIASESLGLLRRYPDHPMRAERERLLTYREEIMTLAEKTRGVFGEEPLCIVNTEVNSKNFIIGKDRGISRRKDRSCLVDWEKAVLSYRYQDLGHFLVPTSTLWKSDYTFDPDSREHFLRRYHGYCRQVDHPLDIDVEELSYRTSILERTILLRAMSWCYMAYYEYTMRPRELKDDFTFQRIQMYLRELECFLQ
jgi:aminoglycoside phosphotransferase (APT) family kinase protein